MIEDDNVVTRWEPLSSALTDPDAPIRGATFVQIRCPRCLSVRHYASDDQRLGQDVMTLGCGHTMAMWLYRTP